MHGFVFDFILQNVEAQKYLIDYLLWVFLPSDLKHCQIIFYLRRYSDDRYCSCCVCSVRSTALKARATIMFILKLHKYKSINNRFLTRIASCTYKFNVARVPGRSDPHPLPHVYAVCRRQMVRRWSPQKNQFICVTYIYV